MSPRPKTAPKPKRKAASAKVRKCLALTPRQLKFAQRYVETSNATQSAIFAGYSEKTAYSIGFNLLSNIEINEFITKSRLKAHDAWEITNDRLTGELARVAFFDIAGAFNEQGAMLPLHEMTPDVRRALASIESTEITSEGVVIGINRKIKLADKLKAIELLMRERGMLNDKIKLMGDADSPLAMLIQQVQGQSIKPVKKAKQ